MLEPLGQLIAGRYRVTERLGEGGMGVVYKAADEQLHRGVAIKFLPPGPDERDRLARFQNEAHALSALNHPNIVTIYEVGTAAGAPFIAMELVDGVTLRERLRASALPLTEALDIVQQTARAIADAHGRGLVHRDIKPENVMIRRDGYVKVLDFGLAALRPMSESTRSPLTAGAFETVAYGVAGTPAYMAPEQLEGAAADARSDIFALGTVLCEVVTGRNPFARTTLLEIVNAINATPAPVASVAAALPPPVAAIVKRALQKDPRLRYQRAAHLLADLQAVAGSDGGAVRRIAPATRYTVAAVLLLVAAAVAAGAAYRRLERRQDARLRAIPEIARLAAAERSAAAFPLITVAERDLGSDPDLTRVIAAASRIVSIASKPAGALVEVKDYGAPDEPWLTIGTTPLTDARVPSGYLRWRISKAGAGELVVAPATTTEMLFPLDAAAHAPKGMVPVDAGSIADYAAFLGWLGPYDLPAFYVDRFEVTNRDYQEFVDKGGYTTREYWTQPFVKDGRVLEWAAAMALLRDATGRPGPSTWDGGHYPDGKADYPVTGVSWYEAAAYAAFSGKSLPVVIQQNKLAPSSFDRYAVRFSNLSATLTRVGQSEELGPYGTFDMPGNAREWYWNEAAHGNRFALGRQPSSYAPELLSPFDRSPLDGFRCVKNAGPIPAAAAAPLQLFHRDFAAAKPASDDVFRVFKAMYAYDKTPLNAKIEQTDDSSPWWTRQRISFDAAYGGERAAALLYLPRHVTGPLQAVVFFPSARVNDLPDSAHPGDLSFVDFAIKSGRAVIYPIYKGMYERHVSTSIDPRPSLEREITIQWAKDLGRSIDYLESRADIDRTRIGYLGVSQGSAYGVILAAIEPRLAAVVLLDGGFFQWEHPPAGLDQVDFAPRITRPVLMINGRYDAAFPVDTSQDPLYRMLGTREPDKQHIVFDTPHDVRLNRDELVRDVLGWYDKYLGRVQ